MKAADNALSTNASSMSTQDSTNRLDPAISRSDRDALLRFDRSRVKARMVDVTFSRILDRSQLEFPTVRSSRFVVGFLCLSSLANAAGGKFANELCGRWTL
jgi:hypothetical protein